MDLHVNSSVKKVVQISEQSNVIELHKGAEARQRLVVSGAGLIIALLTGLAWWQCIYQG